MEPGDRPADGSRPSRSAHGAARLEAALAAHDKPTSTAPTSTAPTTGNERADAAWPDISDYWPDAPHRMGPAADMHELPGVRPTRIGRPLHVRPGDELAVTASPSFPVRHKPRRPARLILGAGLAVLLLVALGLATGRLITRSTSSASPAPPPATVPTSATRTTAFPSAGPTATQGPAVVLPSPPPTTARATTRTTTPPAPATGTFLLADDVGVLTVTTARLDQGVARIGTPGGSNAVPRISMSGRTLRLGVGTNGHGGETAVDVVLDNRIVWSLRFGGGAKAMSVDMHAGLLGRIDIGRGIGTLDIRTPRLSATLPVTMNGGIGTWRITTRGRDDVRVRAEGGAGNVVLYGKASGGLGRAATVTSQAPGRGAVDIDAREGFSTLTVAAG